ncbi:unnamed protein product [Cuscuta campestris]|uniref:Uncharacterized protein n=1 Tax=Cuscuta campestris TaxID=132261 RepID=A0A484MHV0_9ASTE|nr:unnamed protein product [Cuscuta campestris]
MIRSKKSGLCIVPQIRVWLCNLFLGLEMAIGACFGVSPFSFRRRKFSALMEEKEMFGEVENKKRDPQAKCKNGEFKVMTELRNKTLALRDLLDLSPCVGSTSVHDLLVLTLEDLGALYPCAQQFQVSDTEKATLDQILNSFCNAMKSIGEMWTGNDEWMIKSNNGSFNLEIKNSEHHAILMLEDMIKLASERVFDGEEEEEEMVDSPNAFSTLLSEPCSPVTPTSVLPEMFNVPSYRRMGCCSTPIHTPLRVKTARTLSPVGARHLSCHMLPRLSDQDSKVLARFEDFPTKKLEALRMAATLYSKLDGIASTLQQWPKASPVGQLLEKSESYINKIKGDLEKIEQTKDEEEKKYASHKIRFDFSVLVRIKEYMVDVSSNCMELALKEWRDSNAMEKEAAGGGKKGSSGKMLWKAFQFAYRIYTFAGGLDDRADKLTKELAHEIEKEPNP